MGTHVEEWPDGSSASLPGTGLDVDVLIVGAGIAGLYAAYKMRELGLSVHGIEAGSDVGGTWYWNRYPGCRCDVPIVEYTYSFDEELEQEWSFPETNAAQPDIERYLHHVADRHDLRRCFSFETKVISAHLDEAGERWTVITDRGDHHRASYCIMATGALSAPTNPSIPGIEEFAGTIVHTGVWPRDGIELAGRRVGIIGTGSSGIQAIPHLAEAAEHLTVFQRTPNYAFPGSVRPMPADLETWVKANYRELREAQRHSTLGLSGLAMPTPGGGQQPIGAGALADFTDPEVNRLAREEFTAMVRRRVDDPAIADMLIPTDYPVGCKRLVVEIGYFETYNRPDVRLVNLRDTPIERITESNVVVGDERIPIDVLVLATGFDAVTGPLSRIDIRGRDGLGLAEKWSTGPKSYLGLISAGFPNLFTINGPGSPSVLTNVIVSIEQHVDWIADAISHLQAEGKTSIDAEESAEEAWMDHVANAATTSIFTAGCDSWYLGTNVEGKPRVFLPYVGGVGPYREICRQVAADGYSGFVVS